MPRPIGLPVFFLLGGHSLKAAALVSGIYRKFGVMVPLVEIFKIPTIRRLARYIKNGEKGIVSIKDDCLVLIKKKSGKAPSLFFVHDGSGEVEGYAEFCRQLSSEFNCWGLRAEKPGDYAPQRLTIEDTAKKYIKKIKKIQPSSYCIAGWSMGGTIAFEMVRQLERQGERIVFFGMIDVVAPQRELCKEAVAFTLEGEMDFIRRYLPAIEAVEGADENVKHLKGISHLWSFVVDYLQTNGFDPEIIKKVIAGHEALVIPDKTRLSIGELIKYLNMGRTLRSARALYKPSKKIAAPVHYFAAAQSKANRLMNEEQWRQYCSAIDYYTVPGDHFSIFKPPHVFAFAETFDRSLKGIHEIMFK